MVIVGIIIHNQRTQNNAEKKFEDLAKGTTENNATEAVTEETETEEPDILEQLGIEVPEKNLDWDAIYAENEDVYAWLYIPNTNVDYPVLQHPSDNVFYLYHNLDGSSGYPGCIYTENFNSKDFMDRNTLIYGHNMGNGTMFRTLHYFEDPTFFEENRYAFIYMPDGEVYVYDIFAAYEFDDRHIMRSFDFSTDEGYQNYLNVVADARKGAGNFREGVEVTTDQHMITMSTCVDGNRDTVRYLVQGVLVNDPTLENQTADEE